MRNTERVIALYCLYTSVLALLLPASASAGVLMLNLAMLAGLLLLIKTATLRPAVFFEVLRDLYPLALLVLTYWQMAAFAHPFPEHRLEETWVAWDRALLAGGLRAAVEIFGPLVPAVLEFAYLSFYSLCPVAIVLLYTTGRRERVDQFLYPVVLAMLLCYTQFPWWPSEPPRTLYAGMDLPAYTGLFRKLNLWYLGGHAIRTSVFPSAHVAGSFGVAVGIARAMPERPWAARIMLFVAMLIATATVYGRYHYSADAVAGALMALIAMWSTSSRSWWRRVSP
jgi:membrane-associated phospholipid phosphatase